MISLTAVTLILISVAMLGASFILIAEELLDLYTMKTNKPSSFSAQDIGIAVTCITLLILIFFLPVNAHSAAPPANIATITFPPVTKYTDDTTIPASKVITYDVYQGLKGATKIKVGTITSGGQINSGLLTGNEYCWHVVALIAADSVSSSPSNEACKKFTGTPNSVIITVT